MRNHIGESGRLVAATAGELPRCGLDGTAMDNKIPRSLIGRIRHQKGGKSCRSHSPASFIPSRLPVVRASSPRSGAQSSPGGRQTQPKSPRSARRWEEKAIGRVVRKGSTPNNRAFVVFMDDQPEQEALFCIEGPRRARDERECVWMHGTNSRDRWSQAMRQRTTQSPRTPPWVGGRRKCWSA